METNRLRQFYAIYQTGNLRKAAEIVGISHSGLSKSMHALEAELKVKLFLQVGRGISLTDEAHALAQKVPDFLRQLEDLSGAQAESSKSILRIGSFEVFSTYFASLLGPLFKDFDLDFHELVPGKMESALIRREIDMAITYEPIPLPGIEHLKVVEIEMAAYVARNSFKGVALQEIPFAAPLIPVEGAPSGIKGLDSWPDDKVKRVIRYRVDLMETAISMARSGHCAVFIPSFVAKLHNEIVKENYQLVKKALPAGMKAVKRQVYLVKREATVEDEKIKKLAKILRSMI
jgi:DNA-binding transcriptional LysR family regulator